MPSPEVLTLVDHLVYATADLERGIETVEQLLGVRASLGGQHPLWGTRNALLALGSGSYLEIIAPDPQHPRPAAGRPFGLDALSSPRLVGWAAKGIELTKLRDAAAARGVELGFLLSGSRKRADGTLLSWKLTDLYHVVADGIVPFFIDWGTSPHPALAAPTGARLVDLRAEHPDAARVRRMLSAIAVDLKVSEAAAPVLMAEIDCPKGRVLLQ